MELEVPDEEPSVTVKVTTKGQATIPAAFREKFDIPAPGRVRFVERDGMLVVERVPTVDEMMGAFKDAWDDDRPGSQVLLEERRRDLEREEARARFPPRSERRERHAPGEGGEEGEGSEGSGG